MYATIRPGVICCNRGVTVDLSNCSSEGSPPTHASEDSRRPRGVELESGESLQLSMLLPSTVRTQDRRSGALTVLAQPSGRFAGAYILIVRANSAGVVGRIELRYSARFSIEDLIRSLEAEFGRGSRRPRTGSVSWYNRTTTVRVFPRSLAGGQHRVIMIDPRQGRSNTIR